MGQQEYRVEKVVDKRVRHGKTEYFLKWVGYPSDQNTWEPVEHLNCTQLIADFEETLATNEQPNVTDGVAKRRSNRNNENAEKNEKNSSLSNSKIEKTVTRKRKSEQTNGVTPKSKTPEKSNGVAPKGKLSEKFNGVTPKGKTPEKANGVTPKGKTPDKNKSKNFENVTLNDYKPKVEEPAKKKRKSDPIGNKANDQKIGFDRKLKPFEIVAATENDGELMFLMKWEKCDETDLVPAKQAHKRCPQLVIQFYEKRITWKSRSEF